MSCWKVTKLAGWIASDEQLPQANRDVMVWRPWDAQTVDVQHVFYVTATRVGDGKKSLHPSWYPGGSGVTGTYWKPTPKTPVAELKGGGS